MAAAQEQEAIIERRKPFDRKHPLAVIHADDISHPGSLETEGRSTWFKVSTLTVESLKISVRTPPETRIALTDPKEETRPLLKEILWVGGFLDGVSIPLSPDLAALIGGRGTGKSAAVESLRYILGLMPIGDSAKADHEAIVRIALREGSVVKLTVEATSPRVQTFTVERSVNNTPVLRDASSTVTSLQSADVIGYVKVFGQHEQVELASDSTKFANILHRVQGNG